MSLTTIAAIMVIVVLSWRIVYMMLLVALLPLAVLADKFNYMWKHVWRTTLGGRHE